MGKRLCDIITLPPNVFLSHSSWERNTEVLQIFSEEELLSEAWREKEIRCKTCGGCLGLRNIFLLFVLYFAVNSALVSSSCFLPVCCYCLNHSQQILVGVSPSEKIVRWNSFTFLKDFEIPEMKVPVKHNITFSLGQGKNWSHLQLRKNPTVLKWRRNTSTKARVCTQVSKVVIQLLWFLIFIKWNKSTWWSSFWASIFLHCHLCPRFYVEVLHLALQ